MACFDGARIAGSVLAAEVYEPGAVKTTKFMQEAFELPNGFPAERAGRRASTRRDLV